MFQKLKERFTKEPVLTVLDLDKKMRIEVNMSNYAMEEVLSMEASSISFKISKWDIEKLWDSW